MEDKLKTGRKKMNGRKVLNKAINIRLVFYGVLIPSPRTSHGFGRTRFGHHHVTRFDKKHLPQEHFCHSMHNKVDSVISLCRVKSLDAVWLQ
jgi:hypothetical protein